MESVVGVNSPGSKNIILFFKSELLWIHISDQGEEDQGGWAKGRRRNTRLSY